MTAALEQARQQARRDIHREGSVPALYVLGNDAPLEVSVRRQTHVTRTGDIPGLETVDVSVETIFLRFLVDELPSPKRGAVVSIVAGEAYRIDHALPQYGVTVDAAVTRLDATEAAELPLPSAP